MTNSICRNRKTRQRQKKWKMLIMKFRQNFAQKLEDFVNQLTIIWEHHLKANFKNHFKATIINICSDLYRLLTLLIAFTFMVIIDS